MQILTSLPQNFKKIIYSILSAQEIHYIGGPASLPPPLSKDEEEEFILMLKKNPEDAKPILIERNLRLVVYIAKKFENTGINIEDLISIGTIGLIKAINTFNPEKKIKLATYASRCIENEILMYLRKNNNRHNEISIDEPLNVDWDGNELLLSDILGTESDIVCHNIEIDNLSEREKNIMKLRFGVGNCAIKTQKEVADMLGISQSYISRLEKRIIQRMKKDIAKMI